MQEKRAKLSEPSAKQRKAFTRWWGHVMKSPSRDEVSFWYIIANRLEKELLDMLFACDLVLDDVNVDTYLQTAVDKTGEFGM